MNQIENYNDFCYLAHSSVIVQMKDLNSKGRR